MNRRAAILSIALAVLLAALWWQQHDAQAPAVSTSDEPGAIDWYAYGVHYRRFDDNGRLRYSGHAPEAVHYQHQQRVEAKNPHLVIHDRDGSRWITDARFGTLTDDRERVELRDDVRITKGDGSISLRTQFLRGYPARNFAETDRPVTLWRLHDRTDAVGMKVWLDEERYELLSKVVSIHVPNR